jgi:glycosyltransferase involved in cell wall biosynthesis
MFDNVTVIVPTRNEVHNILPFLRSIPAHIPLVVVDSSDDDTPNLVKAHRPDNTLLLRRSVRISEARQLGAEAAQTDWFAFTDADVSFAPDYFDRLPEALTCDLVYGPKFSADEGYARYYRWFSYGQGLAHKLGIPAASGSNLVIGREAFFASGGFDLGLTTNEDTEIVWRVRRSGYSVRFAPELKVYERDHRRLNRGAVRKTVHSFTRSFLLYFNLMPARWRGQDWGYWKDPNEESPSKTSSSDRLLQRHFGRKL